MKIEKQDEDFSNKKKGETTGAERHENKNWLEWSVFGFGVLFTLTVFGYLIYQTIVYKPVPPNLKVAYEIMPSNNGSHRIKLIVKNEGSTAETVIVSASLVRNGEELESGEVQFEYIPKLSDREGWVVFENQIKASDKIKTNIQSYLTP